MNTHGSYLSLALVIGSSLFMATAVSARPGDLDPSFGNGGIMISSITDPPYRDRPSSMLVQPDGKIVVSGEVLQDPADRDDDPIAISFFIARYNSNGTLDTSFGTNGSVVAPFNSGDELVGKDIALQADGKIIAVGYSGDRIAVNRYDPDGTLDVTFGTGGKIITQVGIGSRASSVAVQPDGKIVVVGIGLLEMNVSGFAVVRYDPNGSLDTTFGGGKLITVLRDRYAYAVSAMVQPDGKVVVAGNTGGSGSYDEHFALVRYNADGSLDPDFGLGGKVITVFLNTVGEIKDAFLQPDGRMVLVGNLWSANPAAFAIARYNANGSADASFASNGIFAAQRYGTISPQGIALQPNGKIVCFGSVPSGVSIVAAASRLDANGSWDTGFALFGVSIADFGKYSDAVTGTIQQNGKILLLAYTWTGDGDIAIARFLGDPVAPGPFTISGRVTAPNGQGLRNAVVSLTDQFGVVRKIGTNSFGFYSFDNISGGGTTYTLSAASRRYTFTPRTVSLTENLSDIDLVGLE